MNDKKQNNMESKGKNIPKLRFPGFEGEWEVKKLGDICKISSGKSIPANEIIDFQKNDYYPCYGGNGLRGYVKNFMYNGCRPIIGRVGAQCGNIHLANGKFCATEHALVVTIFANTSPNFISFLLETMNLNQYAKGAAQPVLSASSLCELKISFPTLPEQQKIASCLSSLDGQISAEQSRLESLSQHKRGLMQQLFPQEGETVPKLRFPGFEGEWKVKKLGEICGIISPSTKLQSSEYLKSGKYPVVDQSQSFICGWTNDEKGLVDDPPVIIFGDHTCVLKFVDFPFFQGADGVKILKAIKKNNARFVYQSFLANPIKQEGYKRHFSDLKEKAFYFPPTLLEQEKIASCLTAIDNLIAAQQERIEALKQHKRGLMQQLFPTVTNE